jgi:hypothetical protein
LTLLEDNQDQNSRESNGKEILEKKRAKSIEIMKEI